MEPAQTPPAYGLTSAQVAERVARGEVNANTDVKTKPVSRILAEHAFTLFNAVNVALGLLVAYTGQYRNMTFLFVVVLNLLIGTFQEIRAKRTVDKLTILTARDVRVYRDGALVQVPVHDLVLDDCILLAHGDQIPADSEVLEGSPTVDESLLTGESVPVEKRPGDKLLSGSFVETGSVVARVSHVGMEGFAAKINAEARHYKPVRSEIMGTLKMIIKYATYAMIPLGVGLFLRSHMHVSVSAAILTTVAALVGMIPQGLILLTSSVFAIATTRLGRHSVLVQQSYCVEMLARVDTLCLDKTGTITSGAMEVSGVYPERSLAQEPDAEEQLVSAFASIARANAGDANETSRALLEYADGLNAFAERAERVVPFSSGRKYSGCVTKGGRALVMGAAQFVLGPAYDAFAGQLASADRMERVIVVAEVEGFSPDNRFVGEPRVLGFVTIRDEIRPSASQTIRYFKEQGVQLKVISGDDPNTVSAIAQRVGVDGAERAVDATTLVTEEDIRDAAGRYTIFGRVTPQQKRSLVRALRAQGHTVAMTGDGVNDVLALREADCSVAMAAGSAAARNVAEIVLVDNDFSHLPKVVAEGRRSINNLQRSASLFLVKTVFSAVLALVCIFLPPYPFVPIQMTLVSAAVIGWPSFVLALEPNHDRVSGYFLVNVLRKSLPASFAIILSLTAAVVGRHILGLSFDQTSTLCFYLTALVGFNLVFRLSQPVNVLRGLLLASVAGMILGGSMVFPAFFYIAPLTITMALFLACVGVCAVTVFHILYKRFDALAGGEERFARVVEELEGIYGKR